MGAQAQAGALRDLAALFLKLGVTAFGGPAAHIAMMRDEVVRRRGWLSDEAFLDLIGATNLIPGPNSTEMAIHIGYRRAGWRGIIVAGVCFIVPAMLFVLAFAWAYVRYGAVPQVTWLLYGVKPAIIAVVLQALWGLGRSAVKGPFLAAAGLAVVVLYWLGTNEIVLLLAAGIGVMLIANSSRLRRVAPLWIVPLSRWMPQPLLLAQAAAAAPAQTFSLAKVFLLFLKIGAVLYGSGYVLLAFLRRDFVVRLGWLTDRQLLDAIAVGQFTPGPLFTTATFVGYVLGGIPAAALATIGIFLPAFVFVAASHPLIPRLRRSPWTGALLDGVNVASLALMLGVTWQLGRAAITDVVTALLAVVSTALLVRFRINSVWLVLGAGVAGVAAHLL